MWEKCGCQPQYSQMSPMPMSPMPMSPVDLCGPSYVSPAYYKGKCKYNGDLFVLIVVLFILLIIVGSCSKW